MEKIVVSDTSPLIALSRLKLFDLPQKMWGKLYIPNAVFFEITKKEPGQKEIANAVKNGWIIVKDVKDKATVGILMEIFGPGESECFVLSKEIKSQLLIIDEARGRKAAKKFTLRIAGTMGILVSATKKGLIPTSELPFLIKTLQNSGFRLSNELINQILNFTK